MVIGDHAAPLYNIVIYNVYEGLPGLSLTPWSERQNAIRLKNKETAMQARAKAGGGRIVATRPSHAIEDYVGEFVHPAYGVLTIGKSDPALTFDFHKIRLPAKGQARLNTLPLSAGRQGMAANATGGLKR